ncbi:uncharacterized protein C8Q71DRAFT_886156 [Rhodofomes roseus]|uniref:F-box domain-containing protein n=1 Tax=Rhodofomes roseus TaxID=34475 RepID=A0ABQ8K189_9APHY|nr:uncharacterized protein C8Q71DRAFT_886156 [Rhodofomes roseus]KAH9830428.1 hypothetical protein C8Q71DRAFT_886156 [Rhodofomes roseus]
MPPRPSLPVPDDVLLLIARELGTVDPLGPPAHLPALLATSKHIYNTLCFANAPTLYDDIFCTNFDHRAAFRRLGVRATRSRNRAKQLQKVCRMLTRIRSGDIYATRLEADLWTAFIMLTENDGKNYAQLQWAGLDRFAEAVIVNRAWENRHMHHGWPAESTQNSLAIWSLFMMLDADKLVALPQDRRNVIIERIRPYVVTALRYPSFHAPDKHFSFPLPENLEQTYPYTFMTPHGFYPQYRHPEHLREYLPHFGIQIETSAPLIAQGAKLLYLTLYETRLPHHPELPLNREQAIALGRTFIAPTIADIDEANAHRAVTLAPHGSWDWRERLDAAQGKLEDDGVWRTTLTATSATWDNDWHRWCGCIDPWMVDHLKGVTYTLGSLNGLWQGRLLVPDVNQYEELVRSTEFPQTFSIMNPRLMTSPLYMRLREHHCINPMRPAEPALPQFEGDIDEGICNAWFSKVSISEHGGRVRVEDERRRQVHIYETYVHGRPNSHDETTCTQCIQRREDEEAELAARVRLNARAASGEPLEDDQHHAHHHHHHHHHHAHDHDHDHDHPHEHAHVHADDPSDVDMDADPELAQTREGAQEALGRDPDTVLDEVMADASVDDEDDYSEDEYTDDESEDELEEYIHNTCNGVCDIIITGETLPRHGQAWNHYRFYGRVRKWDGLIALVRVPVEDRGLGTYIFRGYLVGGLNFTGSWRSYAQNPNAIPLEGPFIASKRAEE